MNIFTVVFNIIGILFGAFFMTGGTDFHLGAGAAIILIAVNSLLSLRRDTY